MNGFRCVRQHTIISEVIFRQILTYLGDHEVCMCISMEALKSIGHYEFLLWIYQGFLVLVQRTLLLTL